MNKTIFALTLSALTGLAFAESKFIAINEDVLTKIRPHLNGPIQSINTNNKISVIEIDESRIPDLSNSIHRVLNRCGGFTAHLSLEEARANLKVAKETVIDPTIEYVINQQELANKVISEVKEENIRSTILELMAFETRYYTSKEGIAASTFIKTKWEKITSHRSDISVELVKHKYFPQPSIVLTIEGSERPEEIVILGGHIDSISDEHSAPGADDNASGVASMTEVLRSLMLHDFKPKRTIKIIGYAAEEVGLYGSQDIARSFRKKQKQVIGVMQLDMTLFKGTPDKDIVLISDYTNKAQNQFVGKLIDEYVKVPWGFSACGYGCSDHASWNAQGYPATFAFESNFDDSSTLIHTKEDRIENYGGDASHSMRFSKLASAFLIELSN